MGEQNPVVTQQTAVEKAPDVKWLDPSRWTKIEDESSSGWIVATMAAAQLIENAIYDALKVKFKVAFWDNEDLPKKIQEGWEVLSREHWSEFQEWNKVTAARHGLQEVDGGLLMPNHGWICIMPADLAYRNWVSRQKRVHAGLEASMGSALENAPAEAKPEGQIQVTFTRAGHKDSEVAKLHSEQPRPTDDTEA